MLRAPKLDVSKLLELHAGAEAAAATHTDTITATASITAGADTGKPIERTEA